MTLQVFGCFMLRSSLLITLFSKLPRGVLDNDHIICQSSVAVVFFFFKLA